MATFDATEALADPHAELLALTQALAAEVRRRGRHGSQYVEAFEMPQTPTRRPHSANGAQNAPSGSAPTHPPASPASSRAPVVKPAAPRPRAVQAPAPPQPPAGVPKPVHRRKALAPTGNLDSLRRTIAHCMDCSLSQGPRGSGAIPGRGGPAPRLLFLTDFPGPPERQYGKVLAPEAGKMISDMVTKGFKMPLAEVYVTSAVKCPLAQGCRPSPKETKACGRHLAAEIALVKPTAIVAFGPVAAAALGLSDPKGLQPLRGRPLLYMDGAMQTPVIVTEHPRDMLADPGLKSAAWADLQLLLPLLEVEL